MRARRRRATTVTLLCVAWLAALAAPAAADPAGPTNFESRILSVEADEGGPVPIRLEVLGGDAYLVLRAEPGTEVAVPGYEGEPYLRLGADGTVEVNERSPARWLNEAQLGAAEVDVPAQADPEAAPVWRAVADGGTYAWHDHRVHWMSAAAPPQVDTAARSSQPVLDWEVPLVVDGRDVVVRGDLRWHPGPPVAVVVGLVALALAAGLALAFVRRVPAPVLAIGGALPALVVAAPTVVGVPPGADGDPGLLVLPALSLVLAAVGLRSTLRDPGALRGRALGAAAGLPLLIWGTLQAGALTRPLVPGPLPVGVVRAVTALALALGVAALALLARDLMQASGRSLDALSDEPDPAA